VAGSRGKELKTNHLYQAFCEMVSVVGKSQYSRQINFKALNESFSYTENLKITPNVNWKKRREK
jgi:hypothetical protein